MTATVIVAIYAALVATAALVWNIVRENRKIKVSLATRWVPYDETLTDGYIEGIGVRVTNINQTPIEIEVAGIYYSEKNCWGFGQFKIIQPGMTETYWIEKALQQDLDKGIKPSKIKYGYVSDASGKKHKAKIPQKILTQFVPE